MKNAVTTEAEAARVLAFCATVFEGKQLLDSQVVLTRVLAAFANPSQCHLLLTKSQQGVFFKHLARLQGSDPHQLSLF